MNTIISSVIITYRSQPFSPSPLVSTLSPLPRHRRGNCRRNISASNVARLIRKVRRNIRNYGTHFSHTGRNNEEKTAQLVTTYCAINGTARLRYLYTYTCACVRLPVCMYMYRARLSASLTKFPILSRNPASCVFHSPALVAGDRT